MSAETKNFSGAEIEGLVKAAASYALYGSIDVTQGDKMNAASADGDVMVTMDHFRMALNEVVPAFGVAEEELKQVLRGELCEYGPVFSKIMSTGRQLVQQVKESDNTPLLTALLHGPRGSGKSAIAAQLAIESGFPYVKLVSPEGFVGMREEAKVAEITSVFENAYKSKLSLIILDDLERLLEYVPVGPRFSNAVLQGR
jgi:vesicle-fusing ATPase